ncbi:MAG: D-glycero-beta-D-manno-heptose-7-phosphate kinase [Candidatus Omnitrophota bacterium]
MSRFNNIITKFKGKNILVVGDLILDEYIRGSVSRISPEAPVPIVLQQGKSAYQPGGAANVANNLSSLGAKVSLVGKIGADAQGRVLLSELKKQKINTKGIVTDKTGVTSLKTRIIAHHQQVLRLDREKAVGPENFHIEDKILGFIKSNIKLFDAVILSDYGKGVITSNVVGKICSLAIQKKKIITVDPKVEHFGFYNGVTSITPNKKETENAIRNIKLTQNAGRRLAVYSDTLKTDEDIDLAGLELLKFLNLQSLLITLGEQGMRIFERGKKPVHINTKAREVFDVTGAGDTVISVFTLSLTAGASKLEAAHLANYAAGIVVGKMGAVVVTKEELLSAVKHHED